MTTQWNIAADGSYVGINYVALESSMKMSGTKKKIRARLFEDVRVMESVAIEVLRDRK